MAPSKLPSRLLMNDALVYQKIFLESYEIDNAVDVSRIEMANQLNAVHVERLNK